MKLLLLPLAASSLLRHRLHRGRFASLEECEKAYDELLGHPAETATTTTSSTTTSDGGPITTEPEAAEPRRAEPEGTMRKVDAAPAYFPPESGTGKPSESGWDYAKHGVDWNSGCAGPNQSPIDITKFVDIKGQTKSVLWFDYYADPSLTSDSIFNLRNAGHGPLFANEDVDLGYVKIGAVESEAFEYVFHAPSEHTIDGQVYPLELQILNKGPDDTLVAVSVLFKNGDSNKFLAALKEAVPHMPKWNVESGASQATVKGSATDAFNLEEVLNKGSVHPGGDLTFYSYHGSLTAPPCTGGVEWYVTAEPMEASKEEIAHIRSSIMGSASMPTGNNRETQDLGGREVLVSHTGFQHHIKQHGHKKATPPHTRGYSSQDAPWAAGA